MYKIKIAIDTEEKATTSSIQSHRELPTTTPSTIMDRETEQHLDVESIGSVVDPLAVMLTADNNQGSTIPTTTAISTTTSRNSAGGTSSTAASSSEPITRGAVNSIETLLGSGNFPQILDVW